MELRAETDAEAFKKEGVVDLLVVEYIAGVLPAEVSADEAEANVEQPTA